MFIKTGIQILLLYLAKNNRSILNLASPAPVDVSLKITEKCNSKCITCNIWQEQLNKPEPSIEELDALFHQLKDINIKTLGLYGGEPLLRNDIGEIAKRAKKIIKGVKILVITNGILLKNRAKELTEGGVDIVCVSLDGIGEINDKIRGIPGDYQKVVDGIEELKRIDKQRKIKINIGTTLLPLNIHQVPKLLEFAKQLDISWSFNLFDTSPYHFNKVKDPNSLKNFNEGLVDKTIKYLYEARSKYPKTFIGTGSSGLNFAREYLKGRKPHFNCVLGYLRIYIDSYLNVYSGCWALPAIGNLKKENLKDIINSPRYKERVKEMYALKCPYCTCGFLINYLINSPLRGIKFLFKNLIFYSELK